MPVVINRSEHPQCFDQHTVIDRNIFPASQRRIEIVANEMFADRIGIRMRKTDAVHIGDHHKQQIVAFACRLGDGLYQVATVRTAQSTLKLGTVGHGACHRHRFIFKMRLGKIIYLDEIEQMDAQQDGKDHRRHHQCGQRAEFHRAFIHGISFL